MWWIAAALAAPEPDFKLDTAGYRFDAYDGCFSSGLQLVVEEDSRQPVVTVTLVVDGGSASDPAGSAAARTPVLQRRVVHGHAPMCLTRSRSLT